ncbi:DUF4065 domain-containing protein [Flavitalea sp. BT771]|uniref:type II toxin-antitoxin system antitoxin SocA domain-containing protein n=1 Tax=Flavitalea sp. BT771 TaxID=3063329 RepID=UPI0026E2AD31|nr:type II toxin-antitoxin system antitoxin SocA domain-containing protein [Flavitalea sp. BT771]MDO6433253.1 DUF4065 domain-containing protein [Flavitalea sp. BT771]MDV6221471.1 DUF4065 domain-containing protein [Flavitalea sp. BT771]
MKSPITGNEMKVVVSRHTIEFRKDRFEYWLHEYCDETGKTYTDEFLETLNQTQYFNQYRERYNIPFPDDIKAIREKYGLSATKMSEVLGFGVNVYRQYELGEVPSISNARLITLARDPKEFKKLLLISPMYAGSQQSDNMQVEDLLKRLENLNKNRKNFEMNGLSEYLMQGLGVQTLGIYTGYKSPRLDKLLEMIIFFTHYMKPWKTKMNKLLFYADFLHFKRTCFSISGAEYVAINLGPVLQNFNSLFEYAASRDFVDVTYQEFSNGGVGEYFSPARNSTFKSELFHETELAVLNEIGARFKDTKTSEMVELSHEEPAWLDNFIEKRKIRYDYAFKLIHGY